jgi:geranylgeranyl pyrophosphate synthase
MCSGQHVDLLRSEPTMNQYWETAARKSGVFFALACHAGARLATQDWTCLEGYAAFGHHLGLLVQVLDDLEDFNSPKGTDSIPDFSINSRSLPLAYALEVYPEEKSLRLRNELRVSFQDHQAAQKIWDLIEESGAGMYMLVEIERQRSQALEALRHVDPLEPAGEQLASLIPKIDLEL